MQDFWTINSSDPITATTQVEFTSKLNAGFTRIFQELRKNTPANFTGGTPTRSMYGWNIYYYIYVVPWIFSVKCRQIYRGKSGASGKQFTSSRCETCCEGTPPPTASWGPLELKFQGGPAFGKGRKGNVQETPAKTNMDPKNCNFQIRIYILFQGSIYRCQPLAVSFRGCQLESMGIWGQWFRALHESGFRLYLWVGTDTMWIYIYMIYHVLLAESET